MAVMSRFRLAVRVAEWICGPERRITAVPQSAQATVPYSPVFDRLFTTICPENDLVHVVLHFSISAGRKASFAGGQ
jgi:hypothetical protein